MVKKMNDIIKQIKDKNIGKVLTDVSLKQYTTYKVGGIAKVMVYPESISKLVCLIKLLKANSIKFMVLGFGSNVLFSDNIYDGVVIKLDLLNQIEFKKDKVIAGAGASLMKVALMSVRKGLSGLEFATGIPGSIGGAVYMNAGAYKSDMGYVVTKIKVLTPKLRVITMVNKELDFHYRTSFLKKHPDYICLEATIKLRKGNKEEMKKKTKRKK